jgi:hypothetical protein
MTTDENNIIEFQSQFVEWHEGMMAYFFWDECDSEPIGYWPTKEEAALKREKYGAWVLSDQYPEGNWDD